MKTKNKQKENVKNPLFRMVEKRYGVKVLDVIYVSVWYVFENDKLYKKNNVFGSRLTIDESIKNIVNVYNPSESNIKTVDDIYELTQSGEYESGKNPLNEGKTRETGYRIFLPLIGLVLGRKTRYFRMDNQFISEIFQDSEIELNGVDDFIDLTQEEFEVESKERYVEQIGYLNSIKTNTENEWWKRYFEKHSK